MNKSPYVTASEIGDYMYCRRGWWLRQNDMGKTTAAMLAGTKGHDMLLRQLTLHRRKVFIALGIMLIGIILLVSGIIG